MWVFNSVITRPDPGSTIQMALPHGTAIVFPLGDQEIAPLGAPVTRKSTRAEDPDKSSTDTVRPSP